MTTEIIGRLHPLLVHLPIGIYFAAAFIAFFGPKNLRHDRRVMASLLLPAFIAAALSSLAGWLLSRSGEYDAQLITRHQWTGIAFTLFAGAHLAACVYDRDVDRPRSWHRLAFLPALALMSVTGHFGGTITHGEDYLRIPSPTGKGGHTDTANSTGPVGEAMPSVYNTLLMPVIQRKCQPCHNGRKTKGGLRMDDFTLLMKGGRNGPALIPGDAEHSEIFRRMTLPEVDEKHMPPKGRLQLTEQERELFRWWIRQGAKEDGPLEEYEDTAGRGGSKIDTTDVAGGTIPLPQPSPPDSAALKDIESRGFAVRPIAQASTLFEVSSINMEKVKEEDIAALSGIGDNILWLSLPGVRLSGRGMASISGCRHIRRLDLRNSVLPPEATSGIARLSSLEHLNLSGTDLDDAGLASLAELETLRRLYCWNTSVTKAGVESLSRKNRKTEIIHAVK